jgi:DNA-binding NarL/FixJ family response regulator
MNILLADDDALVIESLGVILSSDPALTIVGSVTNGHDAVSFVRGHAVDLVLMDIQMPGLDGIAATKMIHDEFPKIKILMLTTFHDYQNIHRSLQAGASGYLLKSDETKKQIMTIKSVYAGLPVISEEALRSYTSAKPLAQLTQRENEILVHIANGLSNKEIADRQFITEGTVRNAISMILEKLQVRDRTQLAIYYWQQKR